ncbi:MAG: hypothetical protein RBU45_14440 [Myxococcota bacterium]|jgi:hypothetical protein|nr:hypothetical protein [Myxococcota bacterium]
MDILDFEAKKAEVALKASAKLDAAIRSVIELRSVATEDRLQRLLPQAWLIFAVCPAGEGGQGGEELLAERLPDGSPALVTYTSTEAVREHWPKDFGLEEWRHRVGPATGLCKMAVEQGLQAVVLYAAGGLRLTLSARLTAALAQGRTGDDAPPPQVRSPDGRFGFRSPPPLPPALLEGLPELLGGFQAIQQAWVVEGFAEDGVWTLQLVLRCVEGPDPRGFLPRLEQTVRPLVPSGRPFAIAVLQPGTEDAAFGELDRLSPLRWRRESHQEGIE